MSVQAARTRILNHTDVCTYLHVNRASLRSSPCLSFSARFRIPETDAGLQSASDLWYAASADLPICPFAHPDPVPSQLFQSNHPCVLLKAPLLIVYSRALCTVPKARTKACSIHGNIQRNLITPPFFTFHHREHNSLCKSVLFFPRPQISSSNTNACISATLSGQGILSRAHDVD
jgi:hypothetical protein